MPHVAWIHWKSTNRLCAVIASIRSPELPELHEFFSPVGKLSRRRYSDGRRMPASPREPPVGLCRLGARILVEDQPAMAKHIFVTGGVVSSLGKGLTSASIGLLLERRG